MCIPALAAAVPALTGTSTVLGGLSTIFTIGSGILGAYTAYQGAKTAQAAAQASAAQADQAALQALEEGDQRSDKLRRAAHIAQGDQRVAMAANGVDVTSGNAISLLDETKALSEEDAFAIRENALRSARGYAQQAANFRAEASSARSEALFTPIRTILGTASRVGRRYDYMNRMNNTVGTFT